MPVQICPALIGDNLEATAVVPKYDWRLRWMLIHHRLN
jgi:hypothetical protein